MTSRAGLTNRADLDGLRAVAILVTVAFHAGSLGLDGGFVGVDVFFVLSGFLITSLLDRELRATGRIDLPAFWARRVRRLLPAFCLVVVVTLVLGRLLLSPMGEQQALAKSAIASATLVSNIYFWSTAGSYFAADSRFEPLHHTWSLAIEEQFYLVWPLLLAITAKLAHWQYRRYHRIAVALLCAMFVTSFLLGLRWLKIDADAAFFLLPARAWQLALGGILALTLRPERRIGTTSAGLLAALGFAAIVFASLTLHGGVPYPGVAALLPTLGASAIIAGGGLASDNRVSRILASRPLVACGRLSYSWYLWHWPLLALARAQQFGEPSRARDVLMLACSFALAALTYRFIENPIRRQRPRPFDCDSSTLVSGGALLALIVLLALGMGAWATATSQSDPRLQPLRQASADQAAFDQACRGSTAADGDVPHRCEFGGPAPLRLLIWGDSQALHLGPFAQEVATLSGIPIGVRSLNGCPPLIGVEPYVNDRMVSGCRLFNQKTLEEFATLRTSGLDGIILVARWPRYLRQPPPSRSEGEGLWSVDVAAQDTGAAAKAMRAHLHATTEQLHKLGLRVLIVLPLPELSLSGSICLARHSPDRCRTARSQSSSYAGPAIEILAAAAKVSPDVRLWDISASACDQLYCYAQKNGVVNFVDEDHLTPAAARSLVPSSMSELAWLLGNP